MIDWFIDTFLGVWGRAAVDFYGTYSLPINLVVVAYGAALLFWYRRLKPYREAAVDQVRGIVAKSNAKSRAARDLTGLHALVADRIDWGAVADIGPGRLVTGRWRLWPARASATVLPKLLPVAELCRDAGVAKR